MRWYWNRSRLDGPTYYRATLPLRHLEGELANRGITFDHSEDLDDSRGYRAFFFSRHVPPELLPLLVAWKREGRVIVWDLDDDLFVTDRHRADLRPQVEARVRTLQLCLDLADVITVSTPYLAGRVNRTEKTIVCPNLIDLDDNPIEPVDWDAHAILYSASPSHLDDLELIEDLYQETKKQWPWYFYGIEPPWLDRFGTYIPWSRVQDYPRVCRLVRPAVSLAPLKPCLFNESKSPVKLWETATHSLAVLASNVGPYAGHPAAIVPPGEPFTHDHLRQVINHPNRNDCINHALANSWQGDSVGGKAAWLRAFDRVAQLCSA